jgi:hypothetical protein
MPNRLLARYFAERAVLADLDFSTLKETQPEELFNAWLAMFQISQALMGC